jgi:adenosylmethionine-8-amino-7-oxononanoate aminotransferase
VKGDHILLAPPYIITEAQIDRMVQILDEAIGETEKKVLG